MEGVNSLLESGIWHWETQCKDCHLHILLRETPAEEKSKCGERAEKALGHLILENSLRRRRRGV
jgi:hypothetical protein